VIAASGGVSYTPLQDHVYDLLQPMLRDHFPSDQDFQVAFDKFEILAALSWAAPRDWNTEYGGYWALPGAYAWRTTNRERVLTELKAQVAANAPVVEIIGKDAVKAAENLQNLENFIPQLRWR
jgi:hypothetical protein